MVAITKNFCLPGATTYFCYLIFNIWPFCGQWGTIFPYLELLPFFLFELQYLAGCVGSKEQFFLAWGCCLFSSSLNFNIWLFVRAVRNSFFLPGEPLCGQLETVFLTHYWVWGAFARPVGSSFSYSLLALGGLSAGSWKQFFLLTIGSGGPLCRQLEEVFLLTIGWGDLVRAVGSSFSYSLLARGGLVRAVRSSFFTHYWLGRLSAGSWKQFTGTKYLLFRKISKSKIQIWKTIFCFGFCCALFSK